MTSGRARSAPTNLPVQLTTFIGRESELGELAQWLADPQTRLITLTGPGGMGKTRLSLELAESLLGERPGGCWFAELAQCNSAADIAQAVARALQVALATSEPPEEAVAHVLEYRKPMLLVLDNFEQAVDAAAATVGDWQQAAPQVQFLVTSRAALGLAGERLFELGPLDTPPAETRDPAEMEQFASVQLFCQRARQAMANFLLNERNSRFIAQICGALEGIPLAVELAAARVKVLTAEEIARRLGQRFQLLASSRRDLTPRQQTLAGAIDWSFNLLSDWEKHTFMQACAFRGGFDWEAAEAVIDLSAFPHAPAAVDAVTSLRDKSLLTRQETSLGTRFGMYDSIREYGQERWRAQSDPAAQQELDRRIASHYVAWAESWSAKIFTPEGVEALGRLRLEMENLFAVQEKALASGDAETAARVILAAAPAMAIRGPAEQRLPRLERSLAAIPDQSSARIPGLLTAASEAAQAAGDWKVAAKFAERAVEFSRSSNQPLPLAAALRQQGEMHGELGQPDEAIHSFAQAEEIYRSIDDRHGLACCLAGRGFVVWKRGEADLALKLFTEAQQVAQGLGAVLDTVLISRRRGHALAQQGDMFQALRCFAEAETTARTWDDDRSLRLAIGDRATVLSTQGDFAGALDCYQQAESLARKLGDKRGIAATVGNRGILLSDRGQPQEALACYEQAEAINRAIPSLHGIAVNLGNRGVALADLGRHDEALVCLADAESLNIKLGNRFLHSLNRGDRAAVLHQLGRQDEAKAELLAALDLLAEVHSRGGLEAFSCEALLAVVEDCLGDREAAQQRALAALSLAKQLDITDSHPKPKIRTQLAELRSLTGPGPAA